MFKQIIRSWLNSISEWFKEAAKPYDGDVVKDQIKIDTELNKRLGMPPTDKWCEKNPTRNM